MGQELTARICTDALIAPINDLGALFLKVDLPDGSNISVGASAAGVSEVAGLVSREFGVDLMPMVLADIESHASSTHPYRLRMPADLLALIEPVAIAAE